MSRLTLSDISASLSIRSGQALMLQLLPPCDTEKWAYSVIGLREALMNSSQASRISHAQPKQDGISASIFNFWSAISNPEFNTEILQRMEQNAKRVLVGRDKQTRFKELIENLIHGSLRNTIEDSLYHYIEACQHEEELFPVLLRDLTIYAISYRETAALPCDTYCQSQYEKYVRKRIVPYLDMKHFRTYSSCGKESTVLNAEYSANTNQVTVAVSFKPTLTRSDIPDWASVVYHTDVSHIPVDISKYDYFTFQIRKRCTEFGGLKNIRLELKDTNKYPYYSQTFLLSDTNEWIECIVAIKTMTPKIDLLSEICFVVQCESFLSQNCPDDLSAVFELQDIHFA